MRIVEGRATVDDVRSFVDRLDAIAEAHGVVVQAFDARLVAGREHLEAAMRSARRAVARDDTIADDPAVELLLYAAGRRQIDRALELGVGEGPTPVVVVVDGTLADVTMNEGDAEAAREREATAAVAALLEPEDTLSVGRDEGAIREFFGIGEVEMAATDAGLEALVVERVVLLAVEK